MAFVIIETGEIPAKYPDEEFVVGVHKDEHDIYNDGYDACEKGISKDTNPWKNDTYAWDVWCDGWDDFDMNGS